MCLNGTIRQPAPRVHQPGGTRELNVEGGYVVRADQEVAFRLGPYDHRRALVIDPVLVYSTYFGEAWSDVATHVATDNSGNVYVTGTTVLPPLMGTPYTGGYGDPFVLKLDSAGRFQYATYFGGYNLDEAGDIAVGKDGAVYVTGTTQSPDFPTVNGAQTVNGNEQGGLFKTETAGAAWQESNTGLSTRNVLMIAVDPHNSNIVYAGAAGFALRRFLQRHLQEPEFGRYLDSRRVPVCR
jgi:hypothetical protein